MLLRHGPGGHEILLRLLAPGQIVSDGGTFVAETALEPARPPGERRCAD
jgi:hypothetical protein